MRHEIVRTEKRLGKTWAGLAILLVAAMLLMAGCGNSGNGGNAGASPSATPAGSPAATSPDAGSATSTETVYPLTLTDVTGTEVTFEKAPERVVSLAPSETEILFAVGAGDLVVGVDEYSDYPEEAKSKPKVGDYITNIEAVLAAEPDVVFAGVTLNGQAIEELRNLGVTVFAGEANTIDKVIERVETVALILNKQEQGKQVADRMRAERQKVVDALKDVPKKRVYFELDPNWTVGDGEFISELLDLAGAINVASGKKGWFEIDPEAIIESDPEVILYSVYEGMEPLGDTIKSRPGWDAITAIQNGQVYGIDANLTTRNGPRVTQGLMEMAKAIHPEIVMEP